MDFKLRDIDPEGWWQLDGDMILGNGDVALSSQLVDDFQSFPSFDGHQNDDVGFITGEVFFLHMKGIGKTIRAEKLIKLYEDHYFKYHPHLTIGLPPGMTYSVWRRNKAIERRSWQDEPLPLP